ncbi:MAG: copper ABC transporter ATP-binding protein [Bacteroidetes bacterium GWE2_41_25]|nr:MAG: copper ABC transporter ATP-binding protein [Bacteroidetes bacterium GWA2_40_15]OFX94531.1 MAG: copper ABC transporter ATP-binding protein [Bacteroidetes bacterium GWC2_40_22]OFX96580.1 MAG: copper ABC transporter ATP-binding protein [Bacteroidetes bacterium GWE2_41_25]OFY59456.1 MAG: copper ABC transporter ATP-binding protein [Bacteroidetes bacterium GWF2_41_9]HAM10703.1 copper ABC transporter ATP-binding protein [Bacteroidales bacterium]
MINIQGLNKHYNKNHVLKDINLNISDPGIYAILGPNGSGKTTLLKSIIGLVIPEKGDIRVNGINVQDTPLYRNEISYLPQVARFPDNLRVVEVIKLIKDIRNQEADEFQLIDLFGLEAEMKKKLGNLSGGTRQKVNMLLGFLFDTPVIILDEPTNSLDPVSLTKFKKMIFEKKQQGKIIIYTTHIMSFVEEFSDKIFLLLDGRIIFTGDLQGILKETLESSLENAIVHLVDRNGNDKIY